MATRYLLIVFPIGALTGSLLVQLPVLAALIAGLVVLSMPGRRLPGRAGLLARGGLLVLLVQTLAATVWNAAFQQILISARLDYSVTEFGVLNAIVNFMLSVAFAAGLGLVIAALVAGRRGPSSVGGDH